MRTIPLTVPDELGQRFDEVQKKADVGGHVFHTLLLGLGLDAVEAEAARMNAPAPAAPQGDDAGGEQSQAAVAAAGEATAAAVA